MKCIYLLLGMLLSSSQVFAQNSISHFNLDIEGTAQAYQIPDKERDLNYLLINDKNSSSLYKLNSKMQPEDSIVQYKIDSKYKKNTGYLIENDQPVIFWSTNNNSAIISQKFNFQNHKYITTEFDLNLKKEKFLCQFTALNQLYILTLISNTSIIKAYKFTDSKTVKTQLIDLSAYIFYDKDYKKQNLHTILRYDFLFEGNDEEHYQLEQIDNSSPTPISLTTNKKKFYVENNTIRITLDHNTGFTEIISINLDNNTTEQLHIQKPFILSDSRYELNSNSFIFNDRIIQIKTSTKTLFVTVKDFKGNLITEYTSDKKEEMSFINSKPTLQKNNKNGTTKDIEKTSTFLRQIKNNRISITCYASQNGYIITFGAIEPHTNTNLAVASSFGLAGSLLYMAITSGTSNSMMQKLQAFSDTRSVSATILTDKEFNSIPGIVEPTPYQKIHTFLSSKDYNSKAETLFLFHNKMYLGYFDHKIKQYNFFEFE